VRSSTAADGTVYGPSLGIFPAGCKWRDVTAPNSSDVAYEYWDPVAAAWTAVQPPACRLQGFAAPGAYACLVCGEGGATGSCH
jgi:hypothetical protein